MDAEYAKGLADTHFMHTDGHDEHEQQQIQQLQLLQSPIEQITTTTSVVKETKAITVGGSKHPLQPANINQAQPLYMEQDGLQDLIRQQQTVGK